MRTVQFNLSNLPLSNSELCKGAGKFRLWYEVSRFSKVLGKEDQEIKDRGLESSQNIKNLCYTYTLTQFSMHVQKVFLLKWINFSPTVICAFQRQYFKPWHPALVHLPTCKNSRGYTVLNNYDLSLLFGRRCCSYKIYYWSKHIVNFLHRKFLKKFRTEKEFQIIDSRPKVQPCQTVRIHTT
jgi:hypothetical protein